MKKCSILLITSLITLMVTSVSIYCQEEMQFIDNSIFKTPTRPPAAFEHDAHNEAADIQECNVCHHVYEDGVFMEDESSEDQSCSDCHENEPAARIQPLMKKFHQNCKGCHLEKKAGPVMCGECHKH